MKLEFSISDPSVNGQHVGTVMAADLAGGRSIQRRLTLSNREDVDAFESEVETAFGSEGAGEFRTWVDRELNRKPAQPTGPVLMSAGDLVDAHPHEREYVIGGICREGETVNIVAAPKTYKSFLATMILLCVAAGRMLFNLFPTRKGRVLLIDNELHPETLANRIPKIAMALGILSDEWRNNFDVVTLRGRQCDIEGLDLFFRDIAPGTYRAIVLDALYRFWPEGCDENSNSDVTKVYNRIDQYAQMTGAAIIVIHHASKGVQGNKSVTDTGAGAGAQSRAPDSHLVIRQHEEPDCAVLDAVLRSSAPIKPLGLRWDYPIWKPDPSIDVTKLKRERGPGGRPSKPKEDKQEKIIWTPEMFVSRFISETPIKRDILCSRAAREKITDRAVKGLIAEALDAGLIYVHATGSSTGTAYATVPCENNGPVCAERARTHPLEPPVDTRAKRTRSRN